MNMKKFTHTYKPVGMVTTDKSIVRPNQSMSLEEILNRFTRGEPLAIGQETNYDEETEEDLGKLPFMDLVDKEEYIEKQKQVQRTFQKQEIARNKAASDKIKADALAEAKKQMADEMAAKNQGKVNP